MNYLLLETSSSQMGMYILFGGILGILVIFGIINSAIRGKGLKTIKPEYEGKILQEFNFKEHTGFITADEFAICQKGQNKVSMYRLEEVKYVMVRWDSSVRRWCFCLYDENKKAVKGDINDGKKRKPRKIAIRFFPRQDECEKLSEALMRIAPHIQPYEND